MMNASFGEVKARCMPFLARNALVEELIDWVAEEVKVVSGTMWQLNNNFVIIAIEGVLSMLCRTGCQELPKLRELAASSDVSVVEDVLVEMQKLVGRLIHRRWKVHGPPETLHRLEAGNTESVSNASV
jgi:hypothetical protein